MTQHGRPHCITVVSGCSLDESDSCRLIHSLLASRLASFYYFIARKLAHMAKYGVLTVLFNALRSHRRRKGPRIAFRSNGAGSVAVSDEWHQSVRSGARRIVTRAD